MILHAVADVPTAQVSHLGDQRLRPVEDVHDLGEHPHDLVALGDHVGSGEEPLRLGVELEQLLVEERGRLHRDRLESGPALANDPLGFWLAFRRSWRLLVGTLLRLYNCTRNIAPAGHPEITEPQPVTS